MLLTCKLWSSSGFKAMVCSRQCHPLGVVWTPVGVFLVFGTFEIYWLVVSVIKIESSTYLVLCAQLCSKRLIKMNSFNLYNSLRRWVLPSSLFQRRGVAGS